ncbi:MAG: DNRLRE domain-containing protein [Actinomycetota bacterium]|nr:DNRLRE domain-containing protein [Actinomycetota bacterium]
MSLRRTAAVAGLAVLLALLVPQASQAAAGPGEHVPSLPHSATSDAQATPAYEDPAALGTAVAAACNSGKPLAARRWYTLPAVPAGTTVFARADVRYIEGMLWGTQPSATSRVALVDHAHGAVLGCGTREVRRTAQAGDALAVVLWWDPAELAACAPDECQWQDTRFYAARTTGAPRNDAWTRAAPVTSTPFTTRADSTFADDDGPLLHDPSCGMAVDGAHHDTVWWSYTPSASGEVAPVAEGPNTHVGLARLTATGLVPVRRAALDEDGCETGPYRVTKGATYLVGVFTWMDHFRTDSPLVLGGEFTVRMNGPAPSPTRTVTVTPAADATARQQAPTATSGSATSLVSDAASTSGTASRSTPYVRFRMPVLLAGESVAGTRLSLRVTNATSNGPAVWRTSTSWRESALTWDTRPTRSGTAAVGGFAAMAAGRVSTPISGAPRSGDLSLQLHADSSDGVQLASREAASADRPRLVVTVRTGA